MKFTLLFLLLSFLIYGCKNKELPAKYLSTITVVRETGGNHNIRQTGEEATSPSHATPILPQQANTHSGTRYHIIVGSFSSAEKKRAEQLVEKLKAQDYPATLISSSQRYRVSIESFPTENEANAARDEYRKITDRQDIWVHKVNLTIKGFQIQKTNRTKNPDKPAKECVFSDTNGKLPIYRTKAKIK